MQSEVDVLMHAAGYRVDWRMAGESSSDADSAALVVVELRGVCQPADPTAQIDPLPQGSLLASTAVSDGHILPFSWVHCDSLTALLGHSIDGTLQENFWYGRAMGRLIAHELYHILSNEREHADSGVAKSAFSAQDLVAEHFEFEQTALASPMSVRLTFPKIALVDKPRVDKPSIRGRLLGAIDHQDLHGSFLGL